MKILFILIGLVLSSGFFARADEDSNSTEADRKPAAATPLKAQYPGSKDEDGLTVQEHLPGAKVKLNSYMVQRQVYKQLYNQEQKDDRPDDTVSE